MRYVQGLEALFVDVRGRGVQWSPGDGELAVQWYRAGVELATVARILQEASTAWRYRHGDAALPRSLSWVQKSVEKAASGVPCGPTIRHDPTPERTDADVLHGLIDVGVEIAANHLDPAVQDATTRATKTMKRWLRQLDSGDVDLLERLTAVRTKLIKTILSGVGPAAADTLQREAERRLPAGIGGRGRTEALRHELACAVDRAHTVAMPFWDGWRRPTVNEHEVALIKPNTGIWEKLT